MIGIIDYGMGNLRSVQKAFERLGFPAVIGTHPRDLTHAERLVLPGVGAFRDAMTELRRHDFISFITDHVASQTPLLGICLGLQLLFDVSYEDGEYDGLGVIHGTVERFHHEPDLKIPHMGWNSLHVVQPNTLLSGIETGDQVYFVHSFFVRPVDDDVTCCLATHGSQTFTAMVCREQLFATQFHPEKSQRVGLQLLQNFATLNPAQSLFSASQQVH